MKKVNIVKRKEEFNNLIENAPYFKNKYFVIYHQENNLNRDRFGISVGKKIGNAVIRNKYKRRIRTILDIYKKDYKSFKDYIIIMRKGSISLKYEDFKNQLLNLLINKGAKNEK